MEWLKGKKTFIAAGILALTAVVGFFLGQFDVSHAGLIIGLAAGMIGLGDKWERYGGLVLAGLDDLKKKQVAVEASSSATLQVKLPESNVESTAK